MSKKLHPAARALARLLVAETQVDDWPTRLTLYRVGALELMRTGGAKKLVRDYARAAVEAWGSPPITCAKQMRIWAGSGNREHRADAEFWLAKQGSVKLDLPDKDAVEVPHARFGHRALCFEAAACSELAIIDGEALSWRRRARPLRSPVTGRWVSSPRPVRRSPSSSRG
jgi:hypothetical protein